MKNSGIRRQGVDNSAIHRAAAYAARLQAGMGPRLTEMGLGGVEPPTSRLSGGKKATTPKLVTRPNRTAPTLRFNANLLRPTVPAAKIAIWRRQDVDKASGWTPGERDEGVRSVCWRGA